MVELGIISRAVARTGVLALGSGRVIEAGVGAKAANLDRAAAAGLPVPAGFVIAHCQPAALGRDDLAVLGHGKVAVRSAFSAEDSASTAMAGYFDTELGVAPNAVAITAAIESVRGSAARVRAKGVAVPAETRLDVLVMHQVDAQRAGVLFTEAQFEDDLGSVVDGLADTLVSGHEAGDTFRLAKLRRFERPDRSLPPWQQRLARLLRSVRQTFGEADWDIEWADDGDTCWLVQIRPITVGPRRNEAFTIANHKEILPELPSVLMTSIIESATFDLMEHYRLVDPSLPVDRPFIESFAGRPYINLSQLTDLLRRLGLPTRLLSESLGGDPEIIVGFRPTRVVLALPAFVRLGIAQVGAVGHARRTEQRIDQLVERSSPDFASAIDGLRASYIALVTEMSALATAMAGPVSALRSLGVLDEHIARQRTPGTSMLEDLQPLRELASGDPSIRDDLDALRVPTDPRFVELWAEWLRNHGHRGVYESDVARPRFAEKPDPILRAISHGASPTSRNGASRDGRSGDGASRSYTSLKLAVAMPLRIAARRPMVARERIRWHAMMAFAHFRGRILDLADAAVEAGLLPDRLAVFDLSIEELEALDRGERFTSGALQQRRLDIESLALIRLPDIVHRFDDLDALGGADAGDDRQTYRGVPLTSGTVEGVALRCDEPPDGLPNGFDRASTIMLARSVDAGWVPIFAQVAGIAVEIGGDLSHGSIILRELGLPAATNMGTMANIRTGDRVRLDAGIGTLSLVDSASDTT